jgi:hypothetical protein
MQKKNFFACSAQRASLLFVFLIVSSVAFGQARFWSIFGSSGCNNVNEMPCNSTVKTTGTTVFTGISNISDISTVFSLSRLDEFKGSAYDAAGHLLFSVNAEGIYSTTGYQVFDFTATSTVTVTVGSSAVTLNPRYARCAGCSEGHPVL